MSKTKALLTAWDSMPRRVPREVFLAMWMQESSQSDDLNLRGDEGRSYSPMQIQLTTAREYGVPDGWYTTYSGVAAAYDTIMARLIERHGLALAVERYNGAGARARKYASEVLSRIGSIVNRNQGGSVALVLLLIVGAVAFIKSRKGK